MSICDTLDWLKKSFIFIDDMDNFYIKFPINCTCGLTNVEHIEKILKTCDLDEIDYPLDRIIHAILKFKGLVFAYFTSDDDYLIAKIYIPIVPCPFETGDIAKIRYLKDDGIIIHIKKCDCHSSKYKIRRAIRTTLANEKIENRYNRLKLYTNLYKFLSDFIYKFTKTNDMEIYYIKGFETFVSNKWVRYNYWLKNSLPDEEVLFAVDYLHNPARCFLEYGEPNLF